MIVAGIEGAKQLFQFGAIQAPQAVSNPSQICYPESDAVESGFVRSVRSTGQVQWEGQEPCFVCSGPIDGAVWFGVRESEGKEIDPSGIQLTT